MKTDATDARKLAPSTQEQIRRKAVMAVENGMTHVKAAEVFGVTRHSVDRWTKAYRAAGADAPALSGALGLIVERLKFWV